MARGQAKERPKIVDEYTTVFGENMAAWVDGYRRALNEGGTSSSKTYSILQLLIVIARGAVEPILISVVSESLPHLKRGAIRDFFNILGEDPKTSPYWSLTEFTYTRPGWKGVIEFFGADDAGKVRGPRRDILFINEGNNIPWKTAQGLDIRTRIFTFVDWNPVSEFWVHQYGSGKQIIPGWIHEKAGNKYIHSTYQDAKEVLPQETVDNIESYRDKDPNWWNIYGLGLLGKVEGLVYPKFELIDELPPASNYFYGLDFGFSNDITALTKNLIIEDRLYSQELIYQSGMTNQAIAHAMLELGVPNDEKIYADSAEPKSIAEIELFGFHILGCPKGADSVEWGHQKIRQYKQYWTKGSTNCIKEQRNYRYLEDKDGKLTDKTTHVWSHGLDGRRYGVVGELLTWEYDPTAIG